MNILIKHASSIRKFMTLETTDRDGSLILVIRRDGHSSRQTTWSTNPEERTPQITELNTPKPNNKRITVHPSGQVNYHENGKSIFIEPLTKTTKAFPIYSYRVPTLEKLDEHRKEETAEEDVEFDLSDLPEGPVSFSIILGPVDFMPQEPAVKFNYNAEGYSVTVQVEPFALAVPREFVNNFISYTPERGLFPEQQMTESQAMISYHQALTGGSGIILYEPNGEGFIKMIFHAPMVIAPNVKIELSDPELYVSEKDFFREKRSDKVMLKFKIRNKKTKQIIREPVEIRLIELCALF